MSVEPQGSEIKLDCRLNLGEDFSPPTFAEWKQTAEASLKGAPYEKKLVTKTYEGIDLQPIYTEADIADLSGHLPGSGNHVRGAAAGGYPARAWEICQDMHAPSAQQFNQALRRDLDRGLTGINIQPEFVESLETALADIDPTRFPLHMDAGCSAAEGLKQLHALLKKRAVDGKTVRGSIEADPLGVLAQTGQLPETPELLVAQMAEAVQFAAQNLPSVKTIGISGEPYHNAGADAVGELAYVIATAVYYINGLQAQGLSVDQIAANMRFTFAVGPFYFMEIAKIRAARMLWTNVVDAYGGNSQSAKMTIHARTSYYNQTAYDPYVNMLRTTTEAFSAVTAGVDSLTTNPFNETLGNVDEFSRRAARNTQIMLKEECNLDRLIDPAGGSYFVEALTAQVAENAWKQFQHIEAQGGMLEALKKGLPQAAVKETAQKRRADIAARKSQIVGTNFSADIKESKPTPVGKSNRVSGGHPDSSATPATPAAINVVPLERHRQAHLFETLREAVDNFKAQTGSAPKLFLAAMGPVAQHKARADFSQSFFEVGGFEALYTGAFESTEAAAAAVIESGAGVTVICSSDDTYPELVPPLVGAIKAKNPKIIVVLAGYPKDQIESHKAAGVDEFIYLGADAHRILSGILTQLGVLS